jgi:hypothetical protein
VRETIFGSPHSRVDTNVIPRLAFQLPRIKFWGEKKHREKKYRKVLEKRYKERKELIEEI